jgi:glycerol-3-phosphate acyltransferase PlsX
VSIALDAMGGDNAPDAIVQGALEVVPHLRVPLTLVGSIDRLRPLLPATLPPNITVRASTQEVTMWDKPTDAYRKKKDSSLMVATRMVKEGQAKAIISAGNTGAAAAFTLLTWRPIEGIHRPAIASRMPNQHGGFILMDAGASPDAEPNDLVQFAIMGRAYAESVLGRKNPVVHLLNVGEEEGKGNAVAKATFNALKGFSWFRGNIEGKDMFFDPCDVVICDAFVGNVVLKTSEGIAELIISMIRKEVPDNPLIKPLFWPVRQVMSPLKHEMDYAEIGGSPLLGLNGTCMICHGRSDARAIKNAILLTQRMLESDLEARIRDTINREIPRTE